MTRPPYLHNGDKVALLSPAYCPTAEQAAHAAEALRSWGLEPFFGRHFRTSEADFEYAGTPEQRAADLRDALRDPSVRAIIPVRGGYGSLQLLDLLEPEDFTANPTWLVGYSDITTLLMASVSAGVVAVH
ncbi:MAG: LD-carboxypeptidase, partial [Bacteroidales bacterium]|nr:LD-carboxypeptidase [Bacteroidales bacterium]